MAANQPFGIRVQILFLLGLVALVDFVVADLGILVHQMEVPEFLAGFTARQPELSGLTGNMLLIVSALTLAALLPGLVRKRPRRRLVLDEGLILSSLALLGILGVHAIAEKNTALAIANCAVVVLALFGAARVLLGVTGLPGRVVVAALILAATGTHLWRIALEFTATTDHGLVEFFWRSADRAIPAAAALTAWFLVRDMTAVRRLVAVLVGVATIAALALIGPQAQHILATVTGLWFNTWGRIELLILLGLAMTGLTAALLGRGRLALGLALFLFFCSGFQSNGPGHLLTQAIAIILCGHWAEGRGRDGRDLSTLLF